MGKQIIKQSNGKYAVWSTIIDDFCVIDKDKDEIISYFKEEFLQQVEKKIANIEDDIEMLDKGENPYYQFTKTFDDCLELLDDERRETVENEIKD